MFRLMIMMDATRVTGPAKQLLAVTPGLVQAGIQLTFVIGLRRANPNTPFLDAVEKTGCPTVRIFDRFAGDWRLLRQFRDALRTQRPDLLQTHNYRPSALARLSRRHHPGKWLAWWHGATWENWRVRLYNRIDQWALAGADHVAVVSSPQVAQLRNRIPSERISVIDNACLLARPAVDAAQRARQREALGLSDTLPVVGVFGRFSREKGHDVFLQALAALDRKGTPAQALLLGEGPEELALRQLAGRLHLASRVIFAGYQADVTTFYPLLDFLAIPSRSEGLPNVLLEAMATGIPVVASAVGAVPDVLTHQDDGLLISPKNPEALADALGRLIAEPAFARRLADHAEQTVAERFSLASRLSALLTLYSRVLGSTTLSRRDELTETN